MKLLTLTTDFGEREGYPAAMKGVIYGIAPDVQVVDITHQVPPQDLYAAAFVLEINLFYFPAGSVHVVVVDPGVGTARRPLVGRIGAQYVVAPDNGVLTRLLLRAEREGWPVSLWHADRLEYWRRDVSATFHGRDVFAPLGAHLAAGVPLQTLASPIDDPVRLPLEDVQPIENGVRGQVIYIDHFGNAITNLRAADLAGQAGMAGQEPLQVRICGRTINGLAHTFGDHPQGELLALWDSSGYLMVTEYGGLKQIHARIGEPVDVCYSSLAFPE